MATYTVSNPVQTVWGDRKAVFCKITANGGAYTTGGDVVDPAWFGMKWVDTIIFGPIDVGGNVHFPTLIRSATAAPKIYLTAFGTGSQYSGNNSDVFECIVIGQ